VARGDGGRLTVLLALAANLGIALAKTVGAVITYHEVYEPL
jgi:hypothetical protein